MKKSQLKEIIREVIREELTNENFGPAWGNPPRVSGESEGERLGLDYMSFGRWGKDGKVTHRSKDGRLVPVKTPYEASRDASGRLIGQKKTQKKAGTPSPSASGTQEKVVTKVMDKFQDALKNNLRGYRPGQEIPADKFADAIGAPKKAAVWAAKNGGDDVQFQYNADTDTFTFDVTEDDFYSGW